MVTKDELIKALQGLDVPGDTPVTIFDYENERAYVDIETPSVIVGRYVDKNYSDYVTTLITLNG